MKALLSTCVIALTALSPPAALAESAPHELYGKSVALSWTERREIKYVDGEQHSFISRKERTVYISDLGRYFVGASARTLNKKGREGRQTQSGAKLFSPDHNDQSSSNMKGWIMKAAFVGRSLVLYEPHKSGVDRTEVVFDQNFQTCSVKHMWGKENNAPGEVMRGITGRLQMVLAAEASNDICSVSQGNLLSQ